MNRYITDNPGAWLLHCHVQWHLVVSAVTPFTINTIIPLSLVRDKWLMMYRRLQSGMALVLVEGEEKIPSILATSNTTSTSKGPQPGSGTTSSASGLTVEDLSRRVAVAFVGMLLAATL